MCSRACSRGAPGDGSAEAQTRSSALALAWGEHLHRLNCLMDRHALPAPFCFAHAFGTLQGSQTGSHEQLRGGVLQEMNDMWLRAGAPLAMATWLLYKALRERRAVHLDGQLVLISGASSGIGRELALLLTARGAEVIIVARREAALKEMEKEVEARGWGGRIYALPCDCSDGSAVEELVEKVRAIWGDAGPDVVAVCVSPSPSLAPLACTRGLASCDAVVRDVRHASEIMLVHWGLKAPKR